MAKVSKDSPKNTKKITLLDAAIIGATTPSMGGLEAGKAASKKTKPKKEGKVSLLDAAIKGATTPSMGKSEVGKSAAEGKTKKGK